MRSSVCAACVEVCLYMSCSSQAKMSSLEEELKETEAAFQQAQDQVEQLVHMYACTCVCVRLCGWSGMKGGARKYNGRCWTCLSILCV